MVVGLLHPGSMGARIGGSLVAAGHRVTWCSEGRSETTARRALAAGLEDVGTLGDLAQEADVVLSVCPPAAAEAVATGLLDHGFTGAFAELNAIAPERARRIAEAVRGAGGVPVDGGVVGAPPGGELATRVLLAGDGAPAVAALFEPTDVAVLVIEGDLGAASALKLAFSLVTKGVQAAFASGAALAEGWELGEAYDLLLSGERNGDPDQIMARMPQVATLAWRFAGEMAEAAAACRELGVPEGVAAAAARVYETWSHHRVGEQPRPAELYAELRTGRPPDTTPPDMTESARPSVSRPAP